MNIILCITALSPLIVAGEGEARDQIQDKTDNVEVLTDIRGYPVENERDIGNTQMYEIVPSYVDRRIKEVERSEQKLPFEPSFGWVGRTDFHIPYNPQPRDYNPEEEYDNYSPEIDEDYDRISYDQIEFQPRFSPSEEVEDFGFNTNSQSDAEEGFGKDDLFLDHSDTRDRNSNDYQDIPDYSETVDYDVPRHQYQRQDSDFDDIFRVNPRPTITFGF